MSIIFKKGVDTYGVKQVVIEAMSLVAEYYKITYGSDLVITSVLDGSHMYASKHYSGEAFDVRTWTSRTSGVQIPMNDKRVITYQLKQLLGSDFDVVCEDTHLHCEYDPQ